MVSVTHKSFIASREHPSFVFQTWLESNKPGMKQCIDFGSKFEYVNKEYDTFKTTISKSDLSIYYVTYVQKADFSKMLLKLSACSHYLLYLSLDIRKVFFFVSGKKQTTEATLKREISARESRNNVSAAKNKGIVHIV